MFYCSLDQPKTYNPLLENGGQIYGTDTAAAQSLKYSYFKTESESFSNQVYQ